MGELRTAQAQHATELEKERLRLVEAGERENAERMLQQAQEKLVELTKDI